ncbi:MAG: P-loop NTPase [Polyangiaceae bacterium]|nr:P-loop NTPase [Polyangiaceae bacterium]
MKRRVSIYAFCSIKGGVGKSTLAVASAKLLAGNGRVPVLIDADLTGTSLADGLLLRAPIVVRRADGGLDLEAAPTGKHYEVEDTIQLRSARKASAPSERPVPPAYLNDALTYVGVEGGPDCRVDAIVWKHQNEDGVLYLPSSPLLRDVTISLGWLYKEEPFHWLLRFTWVLDALLQRSRDITDVVLDLPPGVFGFGHETLVLLSVLSSGEGLPEGFPAWKTDIQWDVRPFLVTTPDFNDILPALEYVAAQSGRLPTLVPILNRSTEAIAVVKEKVRHRLGRVLGALGIEERLEPIAAMPLTLGRIFIDQDLAMADARRELSPTLLKERS